MSSENVAVTVNILDKEYRVACPEEEQAALMSSAELLSRRMKEIRDSGKVIGMDRVAVMAALNLTHELLQSERRREAFAEGFGLRLRSLQERIGSALKSEQQLEL
ncbi:MAG: cell division protein ZapA [Gammaproteobacteria bacterium]